MNGTQAFLPLTWVSHKVIGKNTAKPCIPYNLVHNKISNRWCAPAASTWLEPMPRRLFIWLLQMNATSYPVCGLSRKKKKSQLIALLIPQVKEAQSKHCSLTAHFYPYPVCFAERKWSLIFTSIQIKVELKVLNFCFFCT